MFIRSLFVATMIGSLALLLPVADAEAKRLGGGFSFGSKKSFSAPQKKVTPSQNNATTNSTPQGGAAAAAGSKGMMGGMMGGLLAGGLLGALFFGGAFENINFMDIIILALIGFVLFKLLARRRSPQTVADTAGGQFRTAVPSQESTERSGLSASRFFGGGSAQSLPEGFNETAFLEGARNAYKALQHAWDIGELGDLRELTTDQVFAELQDMIKGREGNNETQILELNTTLLQVSSEGNEDQASVQIDASLREIDKDSGMYPDPVSVSEIWHFVRPKSAVKPTWYLQGIQQVE